MRHLVLDVNYAEYGREKLSALLDSLTNDGHELVSVVFVPEAFGGGCLRIILRKAEPCAV